MKHGLMVVSKWVSSLVVLATSVATAQVTEVSGYALNSQNLCDGYPQIQVGTPEGSCVGLVAGKNDGLRMPRYAVQSKEGVIYISEMGGWAYEKGTIWALYTVKDSQGRDKTVLVDLFPNKKLTMPNGLLMDPEGRLYIGTPTAVVRFSPRHPTTGAFQVDAKLETVVDEFGSSLFRKSEYGDATAYRTMVNKNKNKHPLIQMAANKDFTEMYINIGAPSDDCSSGLRTVDEKGKCIQSESALASAAVWKVQLSADSSRKKLKVSPFARGLRNSMALAVHTSGTVLQGENAMDLPDEEKPYEELNVLIEGKHYGWPYCHSRAEVSPKFLKSVTPEMCATQYAKPVVFMPAHTAPLGMLYYKGDLLPFLKNKLLVSWHGYRKYGQRIVAYPIDHKGIPTDSQYEEIVNSWHAQEGVRPRGAPTGITELQDGSILILDDKNSAVLRMSKGQRAQLNKERQEKTFSEDTLRAFEKLIPYIQKNCAMCHEPLKKTTAAEMLQGMQGSMLNMANPKESTFWLKIQSGQMPPEAMIPVLGYTEDEHRQMLPQLEAFMKTLGQ